MAAGNFNFFTHRRGTTHPEVLFEVLEAGVPVNLTGATITITFKRGAPSGTEQQVLSTANGITITDAVAGKFKMNAQVINWPAGIYYHTVVVALASGNTDDYLTGMLPINE